MPTESIEELEQQFLLRMPPDAARSLARDIENGLNLRDNFTMEFKEDMRHGIVRYNGQVYKGIIVDLPCIIESMKTTDRKAFYKTADICQMMICNQDERSGPLKGTSAYLDAKSNKQNAETQQRDNRDYRYLHGITPPLKNVLRRRFRKTRRKRLVDMPKIEKDVKLLLKSDLQSDEVKWEVVWTEPPPENIKSEADSMEAHRSRNPSAHQGLRPGRGGADDDSDEDSSRFAVHRKDVFGELSSSSGTSGEDDSGDDETTTRPSASRRTPVTEEKSERPVRSGGQGAFLSTAASEFDENSNLAQQLHLSDTDEAEHPEDTNDATVENHEAQQELANISQLGLEEDKASQQVSVVQSDDLSGLGDISENYDDCIEDDADILRGGELLASTVDESALMGFPPPEN